MIKNKDSINCFANHRIFLAAIFFALLFGLPCKLCLSGELKDCAPVALPFADGFEEGDEDFVCWLAMQNTAADGGLNGINLVSPPADAEAWKLNTPETNGDGADYIRTGLRSARISATSSNYQWLISREFIIPAEGQTDLRFWTHYTSSEDEQTMLHVLAESNNTWHVLLSWDDEHAQNNQFHHEVVVSLADHAGESIRLAFVYEAPGSYDVAIDDVRVALSMASTSDGLWSQPETWGIIDETGLPGENHIIDIHHELELDAEASVFGLNIHDDGKLDIKPNMALSVAVELLNMAGHQSLVIESDASGNGSLIHHNRNTPLTAQRFIQGIMPSSHRPWHIFSSPVEQAIADFIPETDQGRFFYFVWDETKQSWISYEDPAFENDYFVFGHGFYVASDSTLTSAFAGNVNTEDVRLSNLSLSEDVMYDGWHLLGNPFASSLEWDATLWELENVVHTAKMWQDGGYIDVPSPGGIIPLTTGFFVQVTETNNMLNFPAAARVHVSHAKEHPAIEQIVLQAAGTDSPWLQQSVVRFESDALPDFDLRYDSYFMAGEGPLFHALGKDNHLSTISLSGNDPAEYVYYHFEETGECSHYLVSLLKNMAGVQLFLHDMHENVVHELTLDEPYVFDATSNNKEQHRFALHFTETSLPTDLNEVEEEGKVLAWYHDGQIHIGNTGNTTSVRIYDLQGRLLTEHFPDGQSVHSISAPGQPGLYLIRLTGERHTAVKKLLVH